MSALKESQVVSCLGWPKSRVFWLLPEQLGKEPFHFLGKGCVWINQSFEVLYHKTVTRVVHSSYFILKIRWLHTTNQRQLTAEFTDPGECIAVPTAIWKGPLTAGLTEDKFSCNSPRCRIDTQKQCPVFKDFSPRATSASTVGALYDSPL